MGVYAVFQCMEGEGEDRKAIVLGEVCVIDGHAVFSNAELERRVTAREVRHRDEPDRVLTPADGHDYIRALPQNFREEELFATKVFEPER